MYVILCQMSRRALLLQLCNILLFYPAIPLRGCLIVHLRLWAVVRPPVSLHTIVGFMRLLRSRVLGRREHRGR